VKVNGKLVFTMSQTHAFPKSGEIARLVRAG